MYLKNGKGAACMPKYIAAFATKVSPNPLAPGKWNLHIFPSAK